MNNLIREALAAEADERVDPRAVMAELHKKKSRKRPFALIAATGITVAAVVVAVTVLVPRATHTVDGANPLPAKPQTVLLMGLDDYAHADAITLVHLGETGALATISLPRYAIVDIPGFGMGRLNSAYAQAHEKAKNEGKDPDAAGAQSLVRTVEQLADVKIDHWASVRMAAFGKVADALGGVKMCLRDPVKDPHSGADFPKGEVTLSGEQALAFLRQRHGLELGDTSRMQRHIAFLSTLKDKLAQTPDKLPEVVRAINPHIRTDGWDVLDFLRLVSPTAPMATVVYQDGRVVDGVEFEIDPNGLRKVVEAMFEAGPPTIVVPPSGPGADRVNCVQ